MYQYPNNDAMILGQMGGGYAPLASGLQPQVRTGFEGAPFLGKHPFMAAAVSPFLMQMMQQQGMTPFGNQSQNIYDTMRHRQFMQMQQAAMTNAAAADRTSYMETMRGMAALTGQPFGAEQQAAAGKIASAMQMAAPIMARFAPDMLDQLSGPRGSSVVMANRFAEMGRYRIDPLTGQMGLSEESTKAQSRKLFEDLYVRGDMGRMHGLRAGQAGDMMAALQSRGMLPEASDRDRAMTQVVRDMGHFDPAQLERIATRQKVTINKTKDGLVDLSPGDVDKLALDPVMGEKMRALDTDRMKRSLQSYSKAVAAMRDIFGDMGRPNAPMAELIQGLEAMTLGGTQQFDSHKLSRMVRTTYNLAQQGGYSMAAVNVIQQDAAAQAAQMGLNPAFAVSATQGALGFGSAMRGMGMGRPAWGAMSVDQMTQMDARLRVSAAGSKLTNVMGLVERVDQQVGGFKEGSDAQSYASAVRNGLKQWVDSKGQAHSVNMSETEIVRLMSGVAGNRGQAGLTESDLRTMLRQNDVNLEHAHNIGAPDLVRKIQGEATIAPHWTSAMHRTVVAKLSGTGVKATEASKAASAISADAIKEIRALPNDVISDPIRRQEYIGAIIQKQLEDKKLGHLLPTDAKDRRAFTDSIGTIVYGEIDSEMRRMGQGGFVTSHRVHSEAVMAQGDRVRMEANFKTQMQEELSGIGVGGALEKFVGAVQKATPGDNLKKIIAETFGGVRHDEVTKKLRPQVKIFNDKKAALEELQQKYLKTTDPKERAELMASIETQRRALGAEGKKLVTIAQDFGYDAKSITHDDVERTERSVTRVEKGRISAITDEDVTNRITRDRLDPVKDKDKVRKAMEEELAVNQSKQGALADKTDVGRMFRQDVIAEQKDFDRILKGLDSAVMEDRLGKKTRDDIRTNLQEIDRQYKETADIHAEDIGARLQQKGVTAPTKEDRALVRKELEDERLKKQGLPQTEANRAKVRKELEQERRVQLERRQLFGDVSTEKGRERYVEETKKIDEIDKRKKAEMEKLNKALLGDADQAEREMAREAGFSGDAEGIKRAKEHVYRQFGGDKAAANTWMLEQRRQKQKEIGNRPAAIRKEDPAAPMVSEEEGRRLVTYSQFDDRRDRTATWDETKEHMRSKGFTDERIDEVVREKRRDEAARLKREADKEQAKKEILYTANVAERKKKLRDWKDWDEYYNAKKTPSRAEIDKSVAARAEEISKRPSSAILKEEADEFEEKIAKKYTKEGTVDPVQQFRKDRANPAIAYSSDGAVADLKKLDALRADEKRQRRAEDERVPQLPQSRRGPGGEGAAGGGVHRIEGRLHITGDSGFLQGQSSSKGVSTPT